MCHNNFVCQKTTTDDPRQRTQSRFIPNRMCTNGYDVITCIEEQIQQEGGWSPLGSRAEREDWTPGSFPVAGGGMLHIFSGSEFITELP